MPILSDNLIEAAREVLDLCTNAGLMIATAESCTGGLVAAALTSISGSSSAMERGFVTYSNEAKTELLGVPAELIGQHGAVSEPVARAMAEGAIRNSKCHVAVAITGIAGPMGGSPGKPVGTVHLAVARLNKATRHRVAIFSGDRDAVRNAAACAALELLAELAREA
jgi:nicotinamide-nucleotide amidase